MSRKRKLMILVKLTALALVVYMTMALLAYQGWCLIWHVPGWVDFQMHHHEYEKTVREVKSHPPPHEGRTEYLMMAGGIPAYYKRSASGAYTITLVTADWGHLGSGGYVYFDEPPARIGNDPYRTVDAPGDLWTFEGQVRPHWWVVSNNLH